MSSARGIQQGDPLGPALFGMAIDAVVREATAQVLLEKGPGSLDITTFYLDDGVVAGAAAAVARWLELIEIGLGAIGLDLCRQKCSVVPAIKGKAEAGQSLSKG